MQTYRNSSVIRLAGLVLASGFLIVGPVASAPARPGVERIAADEMEMQGWTFLASSDDTMVYMKHAEPQASGETRQVWTLYNSEKKREREGYSFMSVTSLGEYHCADMKSRILQEHFYEQPSLKGEHHELGGEGPTTWDQHAPGSIGEIKFAFACNLDQAPGAAA